MDSKLVVEQMSGNWKIKHPSMKPLAIEANRLAPIGTTFTWVPRAENAHADRLANEALDGVARRERTAGLGGIDERSERPEPPSETEPKRGWGPPARQADHVRPGPARRHRRHHRQALLRRAGQQQPAAQRRGPRAGPGDGGVARAVVRHLRRAGELARCVRTRETAEILAEFFDLEIEEEPGIAEMEFGTWDGMSFTEVHEKYPDELVLLARRPRVRTARWRVVPRRREAGARGPRPDDGVVRRADGGRRQPRHPDQDPGRRRPRRAARGGLPDGARPRLGHGDLLLPRAARRATSRWPTSGSSTRARPRSSADARRWVWRCGC